MTNTNEESTKGAEVAETPDEDPREHTDETGNPITHLQLAWTHIRRVLEEHETPSEAERRLEAAGGDIATARWLINKYGENNDE